METIINSNNANKYYLRIGKYYVPADTLIKEFIKSFYYSPPKIVMFKFN